MQLKKHQLIPSLLGQQPDAKEEGQDLAVADQSVSAVPAANPSEDLHGSAQHQLSKCVFIRAFLPVCTAPPSIRDL
ncbi:unnamed protein product [Schistocephalus solidus]|uniref:Uncharacterized protein n=1 Tax=Schistocephalus solidus TaxID=70667 RepID=A0A183SC11_SCHSO|nr:unnamed protein product [Schistocephalus solidus]